MSRRSRTVGALAGPLLGIALALGAALPAAAAAPVTEPYPARPVHIVVAASTGGGNDALARALANELETALGQPFVVENKPGASGAIAAETVAKAPGDGYTLLVIGPNLASLRLQFPDLEGGRPLVPVVKLTEQPTVIVAWAGLGVNSLSELVVRARSQPGGLAYATGGIGTSEHFVALMLQRQAGITMVHVPYSTIGTRQRDVATGEVPIVFAQFGSLAGNIRDGKLVPLAVASQRRSILFPDVPTTAEAGYPGVALHSWSGLFAAAGTPPAVIERLHAAIGVALRSPAVRQRLTAQGQEADGAPGPVLAENLRRDAELRARLLHDAGLDFAGRPEPGAHPTLTHQEPHP